MPHKSEKWYAAEAQPGIATFNKNHILFQRLGEAHELVSTEVGAQVLVSVPNVPDSNLRQLIAYAAVDADHTFYKAQKVMSYCLMEVLAQLYIDLGGTPEAWCRYWSEMGVEFTVQADNIFVSPLTFLYGADPHRKYGKIAQALDAWRMRFQPGPALLGDYGSEDYGWPAPQLHDEKPGSSDLVEWMRSPLFRGYSKLAARHAHGLMYRTCPLCGMQYKIADTPKCPKCERSTQLEPLNGDFRLIGMRNIGTQDDAHLVECDPEHPHCVQWQPQRYEDSGSGYEWTLVGDPCSSYEAGEVAVSEFRAEFLKHYSKSNKVNSETPSGQPSPTPTSKAPQAGHAETKAVLNKDERVSATISRKPTPQSPSSSGPQPFVPNQPSWTGNSGKASDPQHRKVVDLEAHRKVAGKVKELEIKLADAEKDREYWKCAEIQRLLEEPDPLCEAMVNLSPEKAIEFRSRLSHFLVGTEVFKAYSERQFQETMRMANEACEKIAAQERAELNADPGEKLIVTFKNILELALRANKPGERDAAWAALERLTADGNLGFLDRLSDKGRDASAPTTIQVSDHTTPLDWFLKMSPEQLQKQAEQIAEQRPDPLDELRDKIAIFLNTLREAALKETTQQSQPMTGAP